MNIPSQLLISLNNTNHIYKPKQTDEKFKTELCKKYSETGKCPYGMKCRFAHGKEELLSKKLCNNYKKKQCKTFYECGYCPYGSRCNFKHNEYSFQNTRIAFALMFKKFKLISNDNDSSLFKHLFDEINNITMEINSDCVSKDIVTNENHRRNSASFSTISNDD